MKKRTLYAILNLVLCMLFYHFSSAQISSSLVPNSNCYATYKSRGDTYQSQKNYNLAAQQYQLAKNCNYLTNAQRKEIDGLIDAMNKKQQQAANQQKPVKEPAKEIKRIYVPMRKG